MSTDGRGGRAGLVHEAALYGSQREFLAVVVPFLAGGAEAGEPTLAAFSEPVATLVRDALPDPTRVTFLPHYLQYARPAATIRAYQELVTDRLADGARHVRITGEVPHSGLGTPWSGWARYEAAVNGAFADVPLWGLCAYDTRTTPADVLADVRSTHPWLTTATEQHAANDGFEDPITFLERQGRPQPDPLEETPPVMKLVDPRPSIARVAVRGAALACGMAREDADDLVAAVQEAVVNALVHGEPPVRLRVWAGPQRTVVTVTDHGDGPTDPFAGLLPANHGPHGGFGLWLIHQMCRHVTMSRDDDGFTIRLVAGRG